MKAVVTVHNLPVHTPFAIAGGTMQSAQCAVVALTTDNGLTGLGEAAPFSAVTGEEIKQTASTIEALCEEIKFMTPESAVRVLRDRSADHSLSRSALCAVECAVIDLMAQRIQMPLWRFFGSPSLLHGGPHKMRTDITVPVMDAGRITAFLEKFSAHEFDTFKVKVSGQVDHDTDCVRAVNTWSSARHQNPRIILDGNQGFDLKRARQLLQNLEKLQIRAVCFEQPLPRADLRGLSDLSRSTTVPVLLDESVTSAKDVFQAHEAGAGSMINIKITKSGVIEALRMIAAARSLGMGMMIGGMLETEIAMGFSLHMATGLGGFELVDLDTPFFIDRRLTAKSPWHKSSALLEVSNQPGSGLRLA